MVSRYLALVVVMFLIGGWPVVMGSQWLQIKQQQQAAPSCPTIYTDLRPCIPYLTGNGDPSRECCSGVKALELYSNQKSSRVAICECLKSYASLVPRLDLSIASNLPKMCKVNVKLPDLSLDIDCSKGLMLTAKIMRWR
ncbi:Non-specific lipid-transfer protein 3 [Linum perenne]